ncbi:MAG TPA: bacillithiol biosynthesis BshC, partial [Gemmatimonadales bacterium]|nr:bacillithiol biosynthesis BshC [Gemmatimonadales bacterium]
MLRIASAPVAGVMPELMPRTDAPRSAVLGGAMLPSAAADRLLLPDALAVTTGQQPGLFGGPMYVLHKALAARALARCLEREWDRPVVPVFWLAGDDHDWDEATRTAWWTRTDQVVEWALQPREPSAPQLPMYREPLPGDLAAARDRLADDLPPGRERDRTIDWIDRHWSPGATIHSAFASGIGELLSSLGVAAIDATHPDLKSAQQPLIAGALEAAGRIGSVLASATGRDQQVAVDPSHTLVFFEGSAGRDRLVIDGNGIRTRRGGERFDPDQLLALLREQPERFSANVLLRPVVEAALLPTVAYVAGPGELRYLREQAAVVYPCLAVTPQQPVPRWGGMVVDQVARRLLAKLDLTAEQVRNDDGSLGRRIAASDLPESIPGELDQLRAAVDAAAARLAGVGG